MVGMLDAKDLTWTFWHPTMRLAVSMASIALALISYAEDPVGHSEQFAVVNILGPVINMFLAALQGDLACFITVIGCVFAGFTAARLVIHPLLRDKFRLAAFGHLSFAQLAQLARDFAPEHLEAQRSKGMLTIELVFTGILLVAGTVALPIVARAVGLECEGVDSACHLGSKLPLSNIQYTRVAAIMTLALDLTALVFLIETMLQDAGREKPPVAAAAGAANADFFLTRAPMYKREIGILRRFDQQLRSKVLPPSLIFAGLFLLLGFYLMHWLPIRWVGSCSELGRVTLASLRLLFDTIIVLQDWEFPHFRQIRRISFRGILDAHFTGKWMNYGILACTLLLDANTVRYHLSYVPSRFGQEAKRGSHLIVAKLGKHLPAYSYFVGYSLLTKLLCTWPVWLAVVLLLVGIKRWRIRPASMTPELTFAPVPVSPTTDRGSFVAI